MFFNTCFVDSHTGSFKGSHLYLLLIISQQVSVCKEYVGGMVRGLGGEAWGGCGAAPHSPDSKLTRSVL